MPAAAAAAVRSVSEPPMKASKKTPRSRRDHVNAKSNDNDEIATTRRREAKSAKGSLKQVVELSEDDDDDSSSQVATLVASSVESSSSGGDEDGDSVTTVENDKNEKEEHDEDEEEEEAEQPDTSDESEDDRTLPKCCDCLLSIKPTQRRCKKRKAHHPCSLAVRASMHALKKKPKLLKKFKQLKKTDPRAFARGILKMVKMTPPGDAGSSSDKVRRSSLQTSELIKCIEEVVRIKSLTRDEGAQLLDKVEWCREVRRRRGCKIEEAWKLWKRGLKNTYTEYEGKVLKMALKKPTEINTRDGIDTRKKKKRALSQLARSKRWVLISRASTSAVVARAHSLICCSSQARATTLVLKTTMAPIARTRRPMRRRCRRPSHRRVVESRSTG